MIFILPKMGIRSLLKNIILKEGIVVKVLAGIAHMVIIKKPTQ